MSNATIPYFKIPAPPHSKAIHLTPKSEQAKVPFGKQISPEGPRFGPIGEDGQPRLAVASVWCRNICDIPNRPLGYPVWFIRDYGKTDPITGGPAIIGQVHESFGLDYYRDMCKDAVRNAGNLWGRQIKFRCLPWTAPRRFGP